MTEKIAGGRRWPLLLALLPLILGLAVYGQLWRGWAAQFETTLAGWFPGQAPVVSGFPYRLETELAGVSLAHDGEVDVRMTAERLRLNRGPWRPELTVVQGEGLVLAAALPGLSPRITAPAGTASLKLSRDPRGQTRLARLSIVLPGASGTIGLASDGPSFQADNLELHAREIEPAGTPAANDPSLPPRGQLVIGAQGLRIGAGAAISLAGEANVRGAAPLRAWRAWAGTGSVDLAISGRDATGELFALDASLVPVGSGLRLAGTVRTVCPISVQAALAGTVPPVEQRLRAPVQLAIESLLPAGDAVALRGMPADLATRPRRGQLPACPRLR